MRNRKTIELDKDIMKILNDNNYNSSRGINYIIRSWSVQHKENSSTDEILRRLLLIQQSTKNSEIILSKLDDFID